MQYRRTILNFFALFSIFVELTRFAPELFIYTIYRLVLETPNLSTSTSSDMEHYMSTDISTRLCFDKGTPVIPHRNSLHEQ